MSLETSFRVSVYWQLHSSSFSRYLARSTQHCHKVIFQPEWKIADPICTFLFSILVMLTTIFIFRDIMLVLLEHTPRHINYNSVERSLCSIPGVLHIHNMRMWSITISRTAISCHMVIGMDHHFYSLLALFPMTTVPRQLFPMKHFLCIPINVQ